MLMKELHWKKILAEIIGLIAGILIMVFLIVEDPRLQAVGQTPSGIVTVNCPSGFYNNEVEIELGLDAKGEIYYTLDCTEPSKDSENSSVYQQPILLVPSETEEVQTIKAKGYYTDDQGELQETKVYTYTYILGNNVFQRYDTYVVSITGDPDGLFGYENGIFVPGKIRDEYLAANPDITPENISPVADANYMLKGEQAEREVTLQMFSSSGEDLLTQNCGLRLFGNATRSKSQKSYQLFARKKYDESGNFHVQTADDILSQEDGTILDKHNRLWFRNSGDDYEHGFIRDSVIQSLARQSGFEMACQDIPVAIYINDEYYGFSWMREPFHDGSMRNLYGDYNGQFVTLTLNEYAPIVVPEAVEEKQAELEPYAEDYTEIYQKFARADLTDEATYQALCERIDVDNYLRYYAIEIYVGNCDWPFTNVKAYRYFAEDGIYTPGTVFDGKYRYLLFDTDVSMSLESTYTGYSVDADTLALLIRTEHSPLFNGLMAREDCRNMLVNIFCDLMNSGFSPENACATLMDMEQARHNELEHFINEAGLLSEDVTYDTVMEEVDTVYDYFENRPSYMYDILQADFPVVYSYYVDVNRLDHTQISVNHIENVSEGFHGKYFAECGLTLKAVPEEGYLFDHWEINGQEFDAQELALSGEEVKTLLGIPKDADPKESISYADSLDVQVVTRPDTEKGLCIEAVHAKGPDDVVVIRNLSQNSIRLSDYYLSVDAVNLKQYELPDINLEGGECIQFYGKENQNGLTEHRLNFKIKQEETLYLSDQEETVIEELFIPDLTEEESYYVRNKWTGNYEEKSSYE